LSILFLIGLSSKSPSVRIRHSEALASNYARAKLLWESFKLRLINYFEGLSIVVQSQRKILMNKDKITVGLVGMPGSGKSLVVETAQKQGYAVVTMGDVVREETLKAGLELNPANVGKTMLEMRTKGGADIVATRNIPKIEQLSSNKVLIDGLRSLHEVDVFRKHFQEFNLLAIHASPQTRFNRLLLRGRSDDPKDWDTFLARDLRELSVGLGNAIAMSEYLVVNECGISETKEKVLQMLLRVEEEWTK
jgi:dephospho-CoA kinase